MRPQISLGGRNLQTNLCRSFSKVADKSKFSWLFEKLPKNQEKIQDFRSRRAEFENMTMLVVRGQDFQNIRVQTNKFLI